MAFCDSTVTVVLWTSSHILYGLPLHQRVTLAGLLANKGPAIYVVHLNRYFVIPPWHYLVVTFLWQFVVAKTQSQVGLTWNKAYSIVNQWVYLMNYKTYILKRYSRNFLKLPLDHNISLISQQVFVKVWPPRANPRGDGGGCKWSWLILLGQECTWWSRKYHEIMYCVAWLRCSSSFWSCLLNNGKVIFGLNINVPEN